MVTASAGSAMHTGVYKVGDVGSGGTFITLSTSSQEVFSSEDDNREGGSPDNRNEVNWLIREESL